MEEFKTLKLNQQPSELCKILKMHDLVQSGGHAKLEIAQGHVKVNGQIETRKAKKIIAGDIIEFENKKFKVII